MKIRPVGAEFSVQTDRQTDRGTDRTKLTATFRNSVKAPTNLNLTNYKISDEEYVG
jgi:hypothetical protein